METGEARGGNENIMEVIAKLSDIDTLLGGATIAEAELIEACKNGSFCILNSGRPPATATPEVKIRSSVLRFLILGGCTDCRVVDGLSIRGAYIDGNLEIVDKKTTSKIDIVRCNINGTIILTRSNIAHLRLDGSHLLGFNATDAHFASSLYMNNTSVLKTVFLANARIDGSLALNYASLAYGNNSVNEDDQQEEVERVDFALQAGGLQVSSTVSLFNATSYATLDLRGSRIAVQLQCRNVNVFKSFGSNSQDALTLVGARIGESVYLDQHHNGEAEGRRSIRGTVDLSGIEIGGQLNCDGMIIELPTEPNSIVHKDSSITKKLAFVGQRMKVTLGFLWLKVEIPEGKVNLVSAEVGDLEDDKSSWLHLSALRLDGFTYERITSSHVDLNSRIKWTVEGSNNETDTANELIFTPQPLTQLAKVLRETGDLTGAIKVLRTREQMSLQRVRKSASVASNKEKRSCLRGFWFNVVYFWELFLDGVFRLSIGYGYYPLRSIKWLLVLIGLVWLPAMFAWKEGSFAPNSAPVIVSQSWLDLHAIEDNPAAVWTGEIEPKNWIPISIDGNPAWQTIAQGRDWETFNSFVYALDVVIPIIDFNQTSAWAPSTSRGQWGWWLWCLKSFGTFGGWVLTTLLVVGLTGIVRKD
jgi:hypothetical protein